MTKKTKLICTAVRILLQTHVPFQGIFWGRYFKQINKTTIADCLGIILQMSCSSPPTSLMWGLKVSVRFYFISSPQTSVGKRHIRWIRTFSNWENNPKMYLHLISCKCQRACTGNLLGQFIFQSLPASVGCGSDFIVLQCNLISVKPWKFRAASNWKKKTRHGAMSGSIQLSQSNPNTAAYCTCCKTFCLMVGSVRSESVINFIFTVVLLCPAGEKVTSFY